MAKIESIHISTEQDKRELQKKTGERVLSGKLETLKHQRANGSGDFCYLKAELEHGHVFSVIVSPYDLLVFAQEILKELDLAKQQRS